MALANEDISFIKQHLSEWIAEESLGKPLVVFEIELRERIVRVEEELKHQRTLIQQILHQMDKRFDAAEKAREQLREDMLDRFAKVDKRFEQVDKRFETLQEDVKKLYITINNQTWRMIGAVGAIVVLSRVVDLFA